MLHSIAFAPAQDLHGRVTDSSSAGFARASGLADFDGLMADATRRAPLRRLANIDDVGAVCAFLASDGARSVTGTTLYVDAGYHILN